MKLHICKTSEQTYPDEHQPKPLDDERVYSDHVAVPEYLDGPEGRDTVRRWYIDLDSIDEALAIADGWEVVLAQRTEELPCIEIVDDYRD